MKILLFAIIAITIMMVMTGCGEKSKQEEKITTKETPIKDTTSTDAKSDVKEMFKKIPNYYVKYQVTFSGQTQSSEISQYYYEGKFRTDTKQGEVITSSYLMDNKVYVCTKQQTWQCFKMNAAQQNTAVEVRENVDRYDITYIGERTYAGRKTKCYEFRMSGVSSEMCYTNDGIPLYIKSTTQGVSSEMKAISVGNSQSTDFTLPAEAKELPSIPTS